jgi:two-component system, NtrC family, nitrogen regulation sensor histidine kinase GlnL
MAAPLSDHWAEQLGTGLAVLDADWRVQWLNGALAEALEVGVRSLRGQPLAAVLADADRFVERARRAMAGSGTLHVRGALMFTLQGRDLHADLFLQRADDGGCLLEVQPRGGDEPGTAPLSATLRGFAHEVKNPLAGLRGAAQLLQRRVGDPELAALAAMVIDEADRLALLADRLLHQGGTPRAQALNMNELLERVAMLLESEVRAEGLQVIRDYDPSLPALRGDVDRLQQLLLNLARNAVEAGATALRLRSRVDHGVRVGERVVRIAIRVDVVDNGRGVPDQVRADIFQPLVSGRAEGTGLGLPLAQEIAREHGGEVRFSSRPGDTTFSLYLPLGEPGELRGDGPED